MKLELNFLMISNLLFSNYHFRVYFYKIKALYFTSCSYIKFFQFNQLRDSNLIKKKKKKMNIVLFK